MLIRHLGVAFRVNALGGAVVSYAVGLKHAALVEELNRTDGRDCVLVLVVDELVSVDDQLVLRLGLRRLGVQGR